MNTIRRYLFVWGLLFGSGAIFFATESLANSTAIGPYEVIAQSTRQLLALYQADREKIRDQEGHLESIIEDVVVPNVDLTLMARLIMGKHWRSANDEQKHAFVNNFKSVLINTYGIPLKQHEGALPEIKVLPVKVVDQSKVVKVRTVISQEEGKNLQVIFSMKFRSNRWRVFDLVVSGVTTGLINSYRKSFSTDVRGLGLSAAIKKLKHTDNG